MAPPSLQARKAALFAKFGGTESPSATAPRDRAVSSPLSIDPPQPSSRPISRIRVSSVASTFSDGQFSSPIDQPIRPNFTGSTWASGQTAVESPSTSSFPNTISGASRVKMAVAALNQLSESSEMDEFGVIRRNTIGSGASQRSWSRLSISTDCQYEASGAASSLGRYSISRASSTIFEDSGTWSGSDFSRSPCGSLDVVDTHPPDMVSPRTVLAHVIAPPKEKPLPSPKEATTPTFTVHKQFPRRRTLPNELTISVEPMNSGDASNGATIILDDGELQCHSPSQESTSSLQAPSTLVEVPPEVVTSSALSTPRCQVEKPKTTPPQAKPARSQTRFSVTTPTATTMNRKRTMPTSTPARKALTTPRRPNRPRATIASNPVDSKDDIVSISRSMSRLRTSSSMSLTPLTLKAENSIPLRRITKKETLKPFRFGTSLS